MKKINEIANSKKKITKLLEYQEGWDMGIAAAKNELYLRQVELDWVGNNTFHSVKSKDYYAIGFELAYIKTLASTNVK